MSDYDAPSRTARNLRPLEAATLVRAVQVSLDEAAMLTAGWSRRQLIDVALTLASVQSSNIAGTVIPHRPFAERMRADEKAWNDADLRNAHYRYNRGERTPYAVTGERIYSRLRRRAKYQPKAAS